VAEPHTGAMVALVPSQADAARLAVPGGEDPGELHCTLAFLGKAVDIEDDVRARMVGSLRGLVEDAIRPDYDLPVRADAFSVNVFNPGGDEPCLVLGVGGSDLAAVHRLVVETLRGEQSPEQHEPWVPHITLLYTDDPAGRVADVLGRTGPVVFDRLRVAFGGEITDIPLVGMARESALVAWLEAGRLLEHLPGLHDQKEHGRRFNIPGDPKSGLRKAMKRTGKPEAPKAGGPGEARKRMSTVDTSTPHRAELAKRNVTDLRAEAKQRGLKPGKANKARLVDLIAEHEQHHGPGSVGAAVKHADDLSATTGRVPRDLAGATLEPMTLREVEIARAKRNLPGLEAELQSDLTPLQRSNIERALAKARATIDQQPGPDQYNWASSVWDGPGGHRVVGAPSAEQVHEHVDKLTSEAKGGIEPRALHEAGAELERQGVPAPRSLLDVDRLEGGDRFHPGAGPNAVAVYYNRRIGFHAAVGARTPGDDAYDEARMERSGWWVPSGDSGYIGGMTAHEFGHHIGARAGQAGYASRRRLADTFDEQLGANGQISRRFLEHLDVETAIAVWLDESASNRERMSKHISRYGSTNGAELLAEVWKEYSVEGGKPRPHIRVLGDALKQMAEELDVIGE
jgi:2'-5' RNA ligase